MKRSGERVANPAAPFWAKSNLMTNNAKAHYWHPSQAQTSAYRSHCGHLAYGAVLMVAEERSARCNICEKKAGPA